MILLLLLFDFKSQIKWGFKIKNENIFEVFVAGASGGRGPLEKFVLELLGIGGGEEEKERDPSFSPNFVANPKSRISKKRREEGECALLHACFKGGGLCRQQQKSEILPLNQKWDTQDRQTKLSLQKWSVCRSKNVAWHCTHIWMFYSSTSDFRIGPKT